jgi:hypothetical protein
LVNVCGAGETIRPLATRVPYLVEAGNHESDVETGATNSPLAEAWGFSPTGYHPTWGNFGDDSDGECGVPLNARFRAPASEGSNNVFWYSFDYSLVHVSVVTAEASLAPGSLQYNWLSADLAAVDRKATPWVVFCLHRPLYNSEDDPSDFVVGVNLRGDIEDLLFENSVDFVLAGHYHAYQATQPVYRNETRGSNADMGAPVHITVGTAGIGFDNPFAPANWSRSAINDIYAFTTWTIFNGTDAQMLLIDANNGSVLDSAHFHSTHNYPAWRR